MINLRTVMTKFTAGRDLLTWLVRGGWGEGGKGGGGDVLQCQLNSGSSIIQ